MCGSSKTHNIDALSLTVTNLNWNPKLHQIACSLAQKHVNSCHITTSSNDGPCMGNYQPGGTATAVFGNLTGRISSKITDSSGMGRWSGVKLHTNSKSLLNIVTVYQSTKSDGINTNYMQQMHRLKNSGKTNQTRVNNSPSIYNYSLPNTILITKLL
jgi:hypothetical protein